MAHLHSTTPDHLQQVPNSHKQLSEWRSRSRESRSTGKCYRCTTHGCQPLHDYVVYQSPTLVMLMAATYNSIVLALDNG